MKKRALPNRLSRVLFFSLMVLSAITATAQNQTNKKTAGGTWYLEYLPPDYNSNTDNYPIVFFLHGIGERGNTEESLANVAKNGPPKHVKNGYKFPFILISPQLRTSFSGWPNSYIDEVIEHCKSYLRVDLQRVYLVGLSLGGGGVWQYAQEPAFGQKLAAIVPVCGAGNSPSKACTFGMTNLPVWAFHGDKDDVVPMSRSVDMVNAINACNPAPNPLAKLTIYNGIAHNSWDNAYRTDNNLHTPNVYQWLLQFKNGTLVANAGPDKSVNLPTNSMTITGSATVQGATVTSYEWKKVSGPGVTISNATSATVSLTNMAEGSFVFRLTVKASNGEIAQDEVTVKCIGSNKAPVANAGPDINLVLPTNSVTIVGVGTDTDGTIVKYEWRKTSGGSATASGTATATLKLSNLVAGTYTYQLTVTDNIGYTATDDVKIVVSPAGSNQLPTVNAGADRTINLPTSTATITATASDPDGSIASYLWEKVSGPSATMANTSTASLSLSALTAGVYTFRITVTDNVGGKSSDDVKVTVIAANQAPVANAGPDITLTLPTNSTNINGSATDPDGSITSYAWTRVSGPNTPTMTNTSSATLSLSNLIQGTYVFRLTVTDNNGATSFDNVNVVVNPPAVNALPAASAGGDKIINLPTNSTSLSGSGNDSDGTIVSYAWTKTSGPAATLTNANSATLLITNLVEGVYKFQLTVTDDQGATATDIATVTVVAANQAPIANAGPDITISLPTNITTITGSGTDLDGTITGYLWEFVSGPSAPMLQNETTPTLTVTGLVEGSYTFTLTVKDDEEFTGIDEVVVNVTAGITNIPPVAFAGPDLVISLPTNSIVIDGSGTDSDGSVVGYSWAKISGPSCTLGNTTLHDLTVSDLQAGSYVFRLTVTDNEGATHSDDVNLTVQPQSVNQTPIANAGPDITLTLPSNSTTISGSGTDPDGTVAEFAWVKVSGPSATLSGENTATLDVSDLTEGVYTFQLTVTDDLGATGSDIVRVTVNQLNQAPVANAGSDVTINLPINSATVNGTGTDSDGTIASYAWTQVSGPSEATLSGETTASLEASGLVAGSYVFRLTVTDDDGATGTDEVTVIVNAANQAPTANAGPSRTITLPTSTGTFTGSGTDPDGTIVSYEWTQISGPTAATLTNATTKTLTVSSTTPGTYYFRFTVTDNDGATAFDDARLTINPAVVNQPPTANAGGNKTITLPVNSINLTGSGSDPDGTIASYAWTKVSGPTATLGNANTATLSLSNLVEGSYVFRLTVTDDKGATATANATVNVLPAIVNAAPVANAGADKTITLPTNSLNITGSGSDSDGTIASYSWIKVTGPAASLANQNTAVLTASDLVQGVYIFRLTVVDDKGASASDEVRVTVNAAAVNQNPVANAGADKTITLPQNSITITGTGSDADGSITGYLWTKVSGPAASLGGANTASLNLTNLVQGTYVFRLRVTDNQGATGTDEVTITVLPATVNQIPVANAGPDKTITLPTDLVTLFGSGSDPDGSITAYLWTKVSGPAATLENETTPTLTASSLLAGTYRFRLQVTDDKGAVDSDDVIVTVNPEATNSAPVANAGSDLTISLPTSIAVLNGSGSDSDGSIASYLWEKVSGPSVTMGTATNSDLSLSQLVEGVYVFRLTVTDDDGASDSDDVTVTVLPAATNAIPVVNAGSDITIYEPANSVTLDGNATDSDGNIVSQQWTQVSGAAATIATPGNFYTQVTGLTTGQYRFRLSVEDDKGATAFDEVVVTVQLATVNQPPVANAGADKTIKLPANTLTINGTGTDPDGTIASYQWELVTGPTVTISGETTQTLSLSDLVEGTYVFRLTVTDDDGESDDDLVQVSVLAAATNLPPVVNAGTDKIIDLPTNTVTLTATVTDDDATGLTILWTKTDGPAATLSDPSQSILTLTDLVEGIYTLQITVTDAGGLTASDEITVRVLAAPVGTPPPTVDAGPDVEIQLPVNAASITASGTSPDGLIVSYQWHQVEGLPVNIERTDTSTVVLNNLLPGTYRFTVTVTDGEGRQASDDVVVIVLDENPLVRPRNLFSPDLRGDASSETWQIENAHLLSDCEILVYDRQGQKVFASIGYAVEWDGIYNGKPVPDGAYYYVIRCGDKISKTGSVTIARLK